jgi:integrase
MFQYKLNSINRDSRRAIHNHMYSRVVNIYTGFLLNKYIGYLKEDVSLKVIFEDSETLIKEFIETILSKTFIHISSFNQSLGALVLYQKYITKRNIIEEKYLGKLIKLIFSYKRSLLPLMREESFILKTQLDMIVDKAIHYKNQYDPLRFKALVFLVYYTGIQRHEFYSLKRENFDLDRCSVKVMDRICYYPSQVRDMIVGYFNSEPEVENAFNMTNSVFGRFNKILSRYSYKGRKLNLSFLRDSNANMIMKKTSNIGVLMNLHGEVSDGFLRKYRLSNERVEKIYKKKIHFIEFK